jgi:hypothetical protein
MPFVMVNQSQALEVLFQDLQLSQRHQPQRELDHQVQDKFVAL